MQQPLVRANFGYEYCTKNIEEHQLADVDLSSWRTAFNGSEPIRYRTLDQFSKKFAKFGFRREAFFPCYGLAESTLMVAGGPPLQGWHTESVKSADVHSDDFDSGENSEFVTSGSMVENTMSPSSVERRSAKLRKERKGKFG